MPGSLIYSALWRLLLSWATLHAFGFDFLGNLGAVTPGNVNLAFTPVFSELATILTSHLWLISLIGISFALWTYAWLPIYILTATRNLLAWALDGLLPKRFADVNESTHSPLFAIVFSSLLGVVFLWIYAYNATFATITGFFGQVCGTFVLTSIAAIVFPYTQKDIFTASPVAWKIGGVPLLSILGVLSLIGMLVIAWAFVSDPQSGISLSQPFMLEVNIAVFVTGIIFYLLVRAIRARQGMDISLAFKEISPE